MFAQLARGMQDLGVGHPHRLTALCRAIDHGKALHHPDLRPGQTIAGHGVHGLDHVVPDLADLVGHLGHRGGGGAQALVGPGQEGADHGR
jgi:hypothetical protein